MFSLETVWFEDLEDLDPQTRARVATAPSERARTQVAA